MIGGPGTVLVSVVADRGSPPVYLAGTPVQAEVSILDNDTAAFTVSAASDRVAEGGTVRIRVDTGGVTFAAEQVLSATGAGDAAAGEDYRVTDTAGRELRTACSNKTSSSR